MEEIDRDDHVLEVELLEVVKAELLETMEAAFRHEYIVETMEAAFQHEYVIEAVEAEFLETMEAAFRHEYIVEAVEVAFRHEYIVEAVLLEAMDQIVEAVEEMDQIVEVEEEMDQIVEAVEEMDRIVEAVEEMDRIVETVEEMDRDDQGDTSLVASRGLLFGCNWWQCQLGVLSCLGGVAAGFALGNGGGVMNMKTFFILFFRKLNYIKNKTREDNYCVYYNTIIQVYLSLIFGSAAVAALASVFLCKKLGRKWPLLCGFSLLLLGSALSSSTKVLWILFIGRIVTGIGIGIMSQIVPVYISESASADFVEKLNLIYKLSYGMGSALGLTVNFRMATLKWGWRICFAIPGVLAIPPLLISFFAHDTPMYYIEMKNFRKARREFTRTRGDGFDYEFEQLKEESQGAWSSLEYVFSRQCRPYLVINSVREIFLQFTGMSAISFFLPTLLMKFEVSTKASYVAPMILEYVSVVMSIIGLSLVARFKRRRAFMVFFSFVMLFGLLSVSVLLIHGHFSVLYPKRNEAYKFFGFLLVYSLGYGVISSGWIEVDFPRRPISVAGPMMATINLLIMFGMNYALLPMICAMKGGLFVTFAVIVVCMLVFISLLVPESSDVLEEEMNEKVWSRHWFWRSYMAPEES